MYPETICHPADKHTERGAPPDPTKTPRAAAMPPLTVEKPAVEPFSTTIAMITQLTGLSRSEIYRLLVARKLKAIKSGRTTLILMAE